MTSAAHFTAYLERDWKGDLTASIDPITSYRQQNPVPRAVPAPSHCTPRQASPSSHQRLLV
ncbi:hypothetical protein K458DRAFT_413115 [Lentithecium fluviatile CBS 122367]|uniref:Uncharacterized protein n=1 Tax=Lentithecium fluviatile CBS 122367 TaxID=1168545 RepID=A0A6G1JIE0_9PLEO|nr:hypothetical protein K458DRAFT_413115 [Lentithecium fluviatile CBS 122367]